MSVVLAGGDQELLTLLGGRLADDGARVHRLRIARGRDRNVGDDFQCVRDVAAEVPAVMARLRPRALVLFPWADPLAGSSPATLAEQTVCVVDAAVSCGARRVLYWGSSAAYASGEGLPGQPRAEGDALATQGVAGRLAGVDAALRDWATGCPQVALFLFRACSVVGSGATWPLGPLRALSVLPRFRPHPPYQVLAAADAVGLLTHALSCDRGGTYNVAADGLVTVSELARALHRPALQLPSPVWATLFALRRLIGLAAPSPGTVRLMGQHRVIDNGRMKTHLGYLPTLTGRQALAAWLTRSQ